MRVIKPIVVFSIISIVLLLGITSYASVLSRDDFADFVWVKFRLPFLAILINADPTLAFDIGNHYFSSERYNLRKAKWAFEKALVLNPVIPLAHYQLARIHFLKGEFDMALHEINKEIALHPDNGRSYYSRGLIYGYRARDGDLKKAESDFITFLKWKPRSWAGYNDLAWVYFRMGDYKKSAEAASRGLSIAPDNPWLNNSLGVATLNLEDETEASKNFLTALDGLEKMGKGEWGLAYPGNDPKSYEAGFEQMKKAVENNLAIVRGQEALTNHLLITDFPR